MRERTAKYSEQGVSLVEFTLAFPIVALLIFGIVDFARYYAVTGVLRAGAEQAINRARKIPNFDIPLAGHTTSDKEYVRYAAARDIILNEAESTPLGSLLTKESTPSPAILRDITMTDNGLLVTPPATSPTVTRSAAVLRPGECADVSGHGQECNGPIGTSLSTDQLLESYPIRIVLVAEVQPFLPFLRPMVARGEAYGDREHVPRGPVAGVVDPSEAGTGTPETPELPVLPDAGSKEPPTNYVECTPDPLRAIQNSLGPLQRPQIPSDEPPPGICPTKDVTVARAGAGL